MELRKDPPEVSRYALCSASIKSDCLRRMPSQDRRPIRAVLFDMDGLLIDSERIYTDVVNEVLKPYGKEQTWEIKAKLMGKPEKEATRTLVLLC